MYIYIYVYTYTHIITIMSISNNNSYYYHYHHHTTPPHPHPHPLPPVQQTYIGFIKNNKLLSTHKPELTHRKSDLSNLLKLTSEVGVSLCGDNVIYDTIL